MLLARYHEINMAPLDRKSLIHSIATEATSWRRELHKHPQTMYEETFASSFIADRLQEWGIQHESGIAKTGIVATIEGQPNPGAPVIAFRADIDALDITEESEAPWKSVCPGKMHACGHDGHTATVLALAKYLQQTRQFQGKVRLIFQPAEEGGRGAAAMIAEGLLDKYPFDEIYGFHNNPYGLAGEFSICPGFMLAATDFFEMSLTGRGGHAAMPSICDDVIVAGSQLVSAIQSLISRETDPQDAAVISITNFHAGTGAANVLPETAAFSGTVRTFKPDTRVRIEERMAAVLGHVAEMFHLQHRFVYNRITDAVFNHPENVVYSSDSVAKLFGKDALKPQQPIMGGEDFGSFLELRPGSFIFAGQGELDRASPHSQGLHTPRYSFNDAIIPLVLEYFVDLAETRASRL